MAIIIGAEAIDRAQSLTFGMTLILKDNPANASGTITSVEIWAKTSLVGCVVGTFYTTNGDTLKCRDSEAIGAVASGAKRTFPVTITVETGDYIGIYYTAGAIEAATAGGAGIWWVSGEYIDPNDETTYGSLGNYILSLYGTGEEEGPTVYQLSVTDGLKAGDTPSESMVAGVAVTDGFKSGDSPVGLGEFSAILTDGVKLGDVTLAELAAVTYYLSVLDGLKIGDTASQSMLANLQLADGTKLGELASLIASVQLTDGIKLGEGIAGAFQSDAFE